MSVNKNFVVKHGLEVNEDLILANADIGRVGIATTAPQYTLHVNGGIGATDAKVVGVATINNLVVSGTLTANSSVGSTGQYLKSTATGIEWTSFPTLRTSTFFTPTAGQTTFSFAYTVGLLDVFINGVKLANTEYAANDGVSVVLVTPCFGNEVVEIIGYAITGAGAGSTGITGITIQEEGSITGNPAAVTSINFVGAAVTAVGTGAGVTVYINDSTNDNYWRSTTAGIHTLSNVGLGTTNPRFALEVGSVGASGTTLYVNGDARITGILTVGSSSITLNGASNTLNVGSGVTISGNTGTISATTVNINGQTLTGAGVTSITAGSGISVDQNTGNVTISANQSYVASAGIATYASTAGIATDATYATSSGIATYSSTAGIATDAINAGYATTAGISTTSQGLTGIPNIEVGVVTATSFIGDGSGLTGVVASGTGIVVLDDGSTVGTASTIDFGANLSVSPISSGIVTVTATGGGGSSQWETTAAGINTLSSVGIGTTNPTSALTVNGVIQTGVGSNFTFVSSAGFTGDGPEGRYLQLAYQTNPNYILNNVGIGTTNATSALTVKGNTSLETLNVSGIATFAGSNVKINSGNSLDFGTGAGDLHIYKQSGGGSDSIIKYDGAYNFKVLSDITTLASSTDSVTWGVFGNNGVDLYYGNSKKFATIGAGVTVTGTTFTNQLNVSGVSTFVGGVFANDIYVGDYDRIFFGNNANFTIGYDTGNGESLIRNQTSAPFAIDLGSNSNSKLSIRTGFASTLAYFSRTNVELYESTNKKFETIGAGVTVTGTTFTNQLNVSGVSTFSGNVRVGVDTSSGVILTSPNGTQYRLIVANDGTLSTVAV